MKDVKKMTESELVTAIKALPRTPENDEYLDILINALYDAVEIRLAKSSSRHGDVKQPFKP